MLALFWFRSSISLADQFQLNIHLDNGNGLGRITKDQERGSGSKNNTPNDIGQGASTIGDVGNSHHQNHTRQQFQTNFSQNNHQSLIKGHLGSNQHGHNLQHQQSNHLNSSSNHQSHLFNYSTNGTNNFPSVNQYSGHVSSATSSILSSASSLCSQLGPPPSTNFSSSSSTASTLSSTTSALMSHPHFGLSSESDSLDLHR